MLGTIAQSLLESKPCQQISLPLLESIIPSDLVQHVLTENDAWERREKKLNMQAIIYHLIGQQLFHDLSASEVWRRLLEGWNASRGEASEAIPTPGAFSQRRKALGVTPLRDLFARVVHPLAGPQTKGAFAFNKRLVALDGTLDNLVDTDANRTVFPYTGGEEYHSSSPQIRAVILMECGTHAILDAELVSSDQGEHPTAIPVLSRSLQPDMLVLWDRGLSSHELFTLVRSKGAHALGRIKSDMYPHCWARLSDGTYLAKVPVDFHHAAQDRAFRFTVRVIEYTLTDERLPGYGERFRLVTTLLDPRQYPAWKLIQLYHERWEIEGAIDECKTHLRLSSRTLRSLTPQGVEQEFYALLLAHFAIRSLMHLAALQANLDPDRLSFTHTVSVVQRSHWRFALLPPSTFPSLRQRLLQEVSEVRLPPRRFRLQRRVVKQPVSKFRHKQFQDFRAPCLPDSFLSYVALLI